jgi:putative nucleotidyltransferase with HDIG domain
MIETEAIEIRIGKNGVDCPTTDGFLRSHKLKGEYLYYHSVQVALVAEQIALAIGLDEERTRVLKIAGYLHDIGKLAVPNVILKKPGPLTAAEWEQIRMHSELGANALLDLDGFEEIQAAILHHHENEDGSGYPYGLSGDDIPVFAKIIKVSDVFTATSSERSYKSPFSRRYAVMASLREVKFNAGATDAIVGVLQQIRIRKG